MLSLVEQIDLAFRPGARRAALVTIPFGALVPIATYSHAHVGGTLANQCLTVGGLVYSGLTVGHWMWGMLVVGQSSRLGRIGALAKAIGFVALIEGTLVAAPVVWVGWACLTLLAVVNAVALQCLAARGLQVSRQARRSEARLLAPRAGKSDRVSKKPVVRRLAVKKPVAQKGQKKAPTRLRKVG